MKEIKKGELWLLWDKDNNFIAKVIDVVSDEQYVKIQLLESDDTSKKYSDAYHISYFEKKLAKYSEIDEYVEKWKKEKEKYDFIKVGSVVHYSNSYPCMIVTAKNDATQSVELGWGTGVSYDSVKELSEDEQNKFLSSIGLCKVKEKTSVRNSDVIRKCGICKKNLGDCWFCPKCEPDCIDVGDFSFK